MKMFLLSKRTDVTRIKDLGNFVHSFVNCCAFCIEENFPESETRFLVIAPHYWTFPKSTLEKISDSPVYLQRLFPREAVSEL